MENTSNSRFSKKREAILAAIRASKAHPSAESIYAQLKPQYPDLSLGTVYRNIARFAETGEIVSVGVVDGLARYDGNTVPHTHFVCRGCNAVIDMDAVSADPSLALRAEREYGVAVDRQELVLFGKCADCGEDESQKRKNN